MTRRLSLPIVMVLLLSLGAHVAGWASGTAVAQPVIDATVRTMLNDAQPGDMITVVVHLRDQASLTTAQRGTRQQRQRAVVAALRTKADSAQRPLRALLVALQRQGKVESYEPLWVLNAIVVTARADLIREVALRADVESITADSIDIVPTGTPSAPPEPNITATKAPTLWNLGNDGQGVVVASLDSGVDVNHPDLTTSWRGGTNSWFDPFGQHPTTPTDLSGHGTATMGVMVGGGAGGTTIGIAPGARWIAARIFDDAGNSSASAIHQAMQWVLDPDGNPATADAPAVLNNSWGYATPGCNLEFQLDVQALRAAGIVPVFSAGNAGPGASTSVSPANYPESLSVGATTIAGSIYSSSSRGPAACGEPSGTYPDVVAPGVNIWTTDRYGLYSYWSGTSIAAPAVSGAVALLLSTGQASVLAPDAALVNTAVDAGVAGPDNTFGHGRIDVAAAYQALTTPPPTTTTTTTTVPTTTSTVPTTTSTVPTTTSTVPTTTTSTVPPTTSTVPPTTSTVPPTTSTVPPTTSTVPPTTSTVPPTTSTVPPTTTTVPPTTTTVPPTTTTIPPTTTTVPPTSDALFADGFESGTTGAWTSALTNSGRLTVQSAAALVGTYGLRANIVNRNELYVSDITPAAATAYHARFSFDPNSVVIGSGKIHDIFHGLNAAAATVITVQVRSATGGYQVRLGSLLRSGSLTYSPWSNLSDAPHAIEVGWRAASTSTGSNGVQQLWLDGALAQAQTTLANGPTRVDEARLGPQVIPTGVSGVEYFDAFASTRTSYIGV